MIKDFTKKKGFTLFEVVIAVCVVLLMSAGIHGMYLRLIKSTKESEEQQHLSVIGKRTLEDIKSVTSDKIYFKDGKIKVEDLGFVNDETGDNKFDSDAVKDKILQMDGNKNSFKQTLYLNSDYKYCEEADSDCKYSEEIKVNKIKADAESGLKSENQDLNLDPVDVKLDDDKKGDEDTEKIEELKYSISKDKDEKEPQFEDKKIEKKDGMFKLDIYFEKADSKHVKVTIKNNGKTLKSEDDIEIDNDKNNKLLVHLDFEKYEFKEDAESEIKKFQLNMHNNIKNDDPQCYVYTENTGDINFELKFINNYVYYRNITSGDNVNKGPLYSINVVVKKKDETRNIFDGTESRNINIEDKK